MNTTIGHLDIRHGAVQHSIGFSEIEFAYLVLVGQGKTEEAALKACICNNFQPSVYEETALADSVKRKCRQIEAAWKAARAIG